MDKYLKNFLEFCREFLGSTLHAIVLYGSRVEGYHSKNSDYDLFVIVENKKQEKIFRRKLKNKRFRKITLQYFETIPILWKRIKNGEWAVYFTLNKTGKIIYATKKFRDFRKNLRKYKINKKKILVRYSKKRNKWEYNQAKKLGGYSFVKWTYGALRKRLYLISYIRYDKSKFNFLKDLERNKDIFSIKEVSLFKKLHKNTYQRKNINSKNRKEILKLMKKINNLCKEKG